MLVLEINLEINEFKFNSVSIQGLPINEVCHFRFAFERTDMPYAYPDMGYSRRAQDNVFYSIFCF